MSSRARKVCKRRGCPDFAVTNGLCSRHYKELRAIDNRPSSSERGYDSEWSRIRREYLNEHPLCVECGEIATEVDHLVPLKLGGTHDWSNLKARCKSHHSVKTASSDGGFGNPIRSNG